MNRTRESSSSSGVTGEGGQIPDSIKLASVLGEDAPSWGALALQLRTGAARERTAARLLLTLEGIGVDRALTPAALAVGIDAALNQADRPSINLIVGCALRAQAVPVRSAPSRPPEAQGGPIALSAGGSDPLSAEAILRRAGERGVAA